MHSVKKGSDVGLADFPQPREHWGHFKTQDDHESLKMKRHLTVGLVVGVLICFKTNSMMVNFIFLSQTATKVLLKISLPHACELTAIMSRCPFSAKSFENVPFDRD